MTETMDTATESGQSLNGSVPAEETFANIPIAGIEHYQVGTEAHIRNAKGHLLTPYAPGGSGKKGIVTPWITLSSKAYRLDRLVLETFVGPAKSWRYGPRHLNGDLADCRLVNLEWEYGLGRKPPRDVVPVSRKQSATTRGRGRPRKDAPSPVVTAPPSTDVQERVFLESGNITVMWNRTEGKVDVSQLPNSSPVIDVSDVPSLIKVLQHVVDR